jgi:PAS domain S-box-containing protein
LICKVFLLSMLCVSCSGGILFAEENSDPASPPKVITSITQLQELPVEEARKNLDVKFDVTVLYLDLDWKVMFVEEGGKGLFLAPWELQNIFPPGDMVELTGSTHVDNGQNQLFKLHFRFLHHGPMPKPLKSTLPELHENWGRWVETEGAVRSVARNNGRLIMTLEEAGERFQVTCLDTNMIDAYYRLVDGRLRVRGVNGTDSSSESSFSQIFTTGLTNLTVLKAGSTNFMNLPIVAVKSLVASAKSLQVNNRVHLQGVASDIRQNGYISLTDSSGTILVNLPNDPPLADQEVLNVWGFPVFSQGRLVIEDGITQPVNIERPWPRSMASAPPPPEDRKISSVITRVKDLRKMSVVMAAQKYPVRMQGVLLFYDPVWKDAFFHDGEASIYVFLKEYPTNLASGQWVEVSGFSDPGMYAPTVSGCFVTRLGVTNQPPPLVASFPELLTGMYDAQWVQTEGVVSDVEAKSKHLLMDFRTPIGRVKATIPNFEGTTPTNMIGAHIRVRGGCGAIMGWDRTKLVGVNINVPSLDDPFFKILTPAPVNLFDAPLVDVQSLYLYHPALEINQPVKLSGHVTLVRDNASFYLQDDTGGVYIKLLRPQVVHEGDVVEVVGFPNLKGIPGIDDARGRILHSGRPIEPMLVDNMEKILFTRGCENQLIRLKGRLLEPLLPQHYPQLVLETGASMYIATLEKADPSKPMPVLRAGSLLELTGICTLQPGDERRPNHFRLLLRNAGDIRVISSPPWWTLRRAFGVVFLLLAVVVSVMGWVWLLHRRVRQKTAQIEEQIRQEQALESRFRNLFKNANDFLIILDLHGRCTGLNKSAELFFGYSKAEALTMNMTEVMAPESLDYLKTKFQEFMGGNPPETIQLKIIRRDKSPATIEVRAQIIYKDNQPVEIIAIARDITERIGFTEALTRERNLLRTLIDHMPDAVFVKDAQGRFLLTNRAYGRMRGDETRDAFVGKNVFDLFPIEIAEQFHRDDLLIIEKAKSLHDQEEISVDAQGRACWLSITKVPLKDNQNHIIGLVGMSRDVTEYKEKEKRLCQLSIAMEQSPASMVITDTKGRIEYVNPKFTETTGFTLDAVRGKNMSDHSLIPSKESVPGDLRAAMAADKEWKGELQNRKADGQLFWESAHISPIKNAAGETTHFLGIYEDITERRSLEAQLRQAQKMESVGQLAAGVAHDFNNLLTVIQGHAEMLRADPAATTDNCEALDEIAGAVKRAANLTRQLLLFSRKQAMQPQALDLSQLIADLGKMLQRLLGEHVEMHIYCQSDGVIISADPGMIEQIIVNLCVNARDAMPNGGLLTLETKLVEFAESTLLPHAEARPGRFLCLSVSDTGHGMDEKTMARIFEPFYTTKPKGKGTGLGLATVYGIIKQHQGWIDVLSAPGKGTTFRIYFPVVEKIAKTVQAGSSAGEMRGGSECVLVVEDEDPLRLMVQLVLKRKGYRVICATSGVEALKLWKDCGQEVDLLLTDMVMPHGMTGRQLAEQLLAERPSLRVVYTSGYSVDFTAPGHNFQEGFNFLPKPYRPEDLVKIVRSCLDRTAKKASA